MINVRIYYVFGLGHTFLYEDTVIQSLLQSLTFLLQKQLVPITPPIIIREPIK